MTKSRVGLDIRSSVNSSESMECSSTRTGMIIASAAHQAKWGPPASYVERQYLAVSVQPPACLVLPRRGSAGVSSVSAAALHSDCLPGYLGGKEKQGLLPPSFTQLAIAAIQARKDIPRFN